MQSHGRGVVLDVELVLELLDVLLLGSAVVLLLLVTAIREHGSGVVLLLGSAVVLLDVLLVELLLVELVELVLLVPSAQVELTRVQRLLLFDHTHLHDPLHVEGGVWVVEVVVEDHGFSSIQAWAEWAMTSMPTSPGIDHTRVCIW